MVNKNNQLPKNNISVGDYSADKRKITDKLLISEIADQITDTLKILISH